MNLFTPSDKKLNQPDRDNRQTPAKITSPRTIRTTNSQTNRTETPRPTARPNPRTSEEANSQTHPPTPDTPLACKLLDLY